MYVLHIDDEPPIRSMVADMLEALGYEAGSASSVAEGLKLAGERKPDLIIMDVMMPGVDGYEGCRRFRAIEAFREVPILMLSALGSRQDQERARQAGANDFLVKPIGMAAFKAKLEQFVR
ncbi:MAG: response regulator [Elusimicrobia bacterium]|nr:response regulator [Elusimicrobiota bacterium]